MARRTVQPPPGKSPAKRPKAAAAKDKRLLAEIRTGLADEKKSGRVPLRDVDRGRARHGGV